VIDQFLASRRPDWERLEALVARARDQAGRLSADEIEELGRLYRRSTSDLALARRDFGRDRVARYLEQLVGRAHPVVYRRRRGEWRDLWRFVAVGFPRAFREAWPYTAAAAALFVVPCLLAFAATRIDPINGRILIGARTFVERVEQGQSWLEAPRAQQGPLLSSFVMVNNIQVAFLAVAGGVLFGLGTVYVLIANGISIGAVAGLAATYGLGPTLSDFAAAHGGIELTVIFVAGGGGLRMGRALLWPGLLPRRAALAAAARRAFTLLLGCVPLLAIAGTLEGTVSPSALPGAAKLAVGLLATSALYAYLLLAGRR